MRFTVDQWDPSYGTSVEPDAGEDHVQVDADAELPAPDWQPLQPAPSPPGPLLFVDGVRRVDARLWIGGGDAGAHSGVCASWAAGVVHCVPGEAAVVEGIEVGRSVAAALPVAEIEPILLPGGLGVYEPVQATAPTPEALWLAVQNEMGRCERRLAERAGATGGGGGALVVVDGPLRGRDHLPGQVGMVKTHHVDYLTDRPARVLHTLRTGQRTPVFAIAGAFERWSWYVGLDAGGTGVPMAGVVRCEVGGRSRLADAIAVADRVTAELPRYASEAHKDHRAPQNLYPIAGLERLLRHRLGDSRLLYRGLRQAAMRSA